MMKQSRPKTAGYKSFGSRLWTEDEENKVKVGLLEGKSIAEIATTCNRTEKAIRMRTLHLADQDIRKGATSDVVLKKYRITEGEFAEYNKNSKCKFDECKNARSSKSVLGYCAEHLNIERVGKYDLDSITTQIKQNSEKIDKLAVVVMAIANHFKVQLPV
jgi:hypothetical protein